MYCSNMFRGNNVPVDLLLWENESKVYLTAHSASMFESEINCKRCVTCYSKFLFFFILTFRRSY